MVFEQTGLKCHVCQAINLCFVAQLLSHKEVLQVEVFCTDCRAMHGYSLADDYVQMWMNNHFPYPCLHCKH
jgi:hypothetical protein